MERELPLPFGKLQISFRGIQFVVCLILGILSLLLLSAAGIFFFRAMALACVFLLLAPVRICCGKRVSALLRWGWILASGMAGLCLTQLLLNADLSHLAHQRIFLGSLCTLAPVLLLLALTGRMHLSVTAGLLVNMFLATVNYFVYAFRGNEFAPYDILAFATAMDVVGQYTFQIDPPFAYAWCLGAAYLAGGFCLPQQPKREKPHRLAHGILAAAAAILLICGIGCTKKQDYANMGTVYNGYVLNFLCRMNAGRVQKPESYDAEALRQLEQQYACGPSDAEKPHVIVIMNESFSDLQVLGQLKTSTSATPFYDSLLADTIHGYALASTIGGGTCNSEFQFLTGHNMGFLPDGCYPYQQYIKNDTYSVFAAMERMGYATIATHPEKAENWMRQAVYPRFGVDTLHFTEDYPHEDLIRSFVSDREMYAQMLLWLESATPEQPQFLFGITMQNHGGYAYDWESWDRTVVPEGLSRQYRDAEQYLWLLQQSDGALEMLIHRLQTWEAPVVVLFFGDHLPSLQADFYEELHGGSFDTLDEQMQQYMVPFFVWANYDIHERDVGLTSLNFLANYLFEAANLPFPAYNAFLKDVQEVIPAMNAFGYYSLAEECFLPYEDARGEEAAWLEKYRILQYNAIFDPENKSTVFFPDP